MRQDPDMSCVSSRQSAVQEETLMAVPTGVKRRLMSAQPEGTPTSHAARRPVTARSGLRPQGRRWPAGPVVQLDTQLRVRPPVFGPETAHRLVARVRRVPRGLFDAAAILDDPEDSLGLLVLNGLIAVGLDVGRAQVSWLVGPDDLVRPWDMGDIALTNTSHWRALTNVRVALLDGDFSSRSGSSPAVARALVGRATQTSQWLLAKSLILSSPVVEDRLLMLFALLAERWGKVRPEGVRLELPLTHDLLARMSGARRPSVTTALRSLRDAGLVEGLRRGCWLLRSCPSCWESSADWAANPCWRLYAEAIGLADVAGRGDDGIGRAPAA
jgi:CRP/FNR family transcriptional regulator, cyclic AMP receptor protein